MDAQPLDLAADLATLPETLARLRSAFDRGVTRPLAWRKAQLTRLAEMMVAEERRIVDALRADLAKPEIEAVMSESAMVAGDARRAIRNLARWTAKRPVAAPLSVLPGRAYVRPEPWGVVAIFGAWNYPLQELYLPMVGALAAGNAVLLKPSEVAGASSALVAELTAKYLDPDAVAVVQGGRAVAEALLEHPFDYVFFTGSTATGRKVALACAKHLTPVTLELGGKSPAIVAADADLTVAARRIAWGRFMNAGQICVSPDHVLVDAAVHDRLLEELVAATRAFYGDDPKASPDYARIVSDAHLQRLARLIPDGTGAGGRIVLGGQVDPATRYVAPTILAELPWDAPAMREEIFGPILPVLKVSSATEAINRVRAEPAPLCVYVFTGDAALAERAEQETRSGTFIQNDVIVSQTVHGLPFGGVGQSGMGSFHGVHSFETFTQKKAVLRRPTMLDAAMRYPPYTEGKVKMLRKFL